MLLMVSPSSAISPRASTVNFFFRSPRAMAVTTLAMPRTWLVRFEAIMFTLSVRSFHVPETPLTCAWPPSTSQGSLRYVEGPHRQREHDGLEPDQPGARHRQGRHRHRPR